MRIKTILLLIFYAVINSIYCQSQEVTGINKERKGGRVPPEYLEKTIASNIYSQVLLLSFNGNSASSVIVTVDSIGYITTVKHLFDSSIEHGQKVDIAVLKTIPEFKKIKSFQDRPGNLIIGDEGFMLGFPLNLKTEVGEFNNSNPVPLIRKSILSGIISQDSIRYIIVDGISIDGFSGGPVLIKSFTSGEWSLAGIIKGSIYDEEEKQLGKSNQIIKIRHNSGFTAATDARYIFEIIENIK